MAGTIEKKGKRQSVPFSKGVPTRTKTYLKLRNMLLSFRNFLNYHKFPQRRKITEQTQHHRNYLFSTKNLQSSIPSPPLPHSRLKSLIPVTISVSSLSCRSLSRFVRDMKVPSSVCGNTLCKAAATTRITQLEKSHIALCYEFKIRLDTFSIKILVLTDFWMMQQGNPAAQSITSSCISY